LFAFPVFAQTAPAPKPIDLLKQKLEQIGAGVTAAGCLTQRSV